MKNTYLFGLITATLLVGCGGGGTPESDITQSSNISSSSVPSSTTASSTTVQCKDVYPVLESLNKKYASSKDEDARYSLDYQVYADEKGSGDGKASGDGKGSDDGGGIHNQGKACSQCHSFSGATVFTSLTASNSTLGALGHKIQLGGSHVYSGGRGDGNSHLQGFNGDKFTANVIDASGNIVNSSAENSHDASRLDCNRCHTASGSNGAPGRITSFKITSSVPTPTTTNCVSFKGNIMPILEQKCKSCHGSNGNFTVTSVGATYANIAALKSSAITGGEYLLDKGSNTTGHGGGKVISTTSGEYTTIKAWIMEGALNN